MNYKESKAILESIKAAKNILVTSHTEPDADSIGSALGLFLALKKINKKVSLVCKDEVPEYLRFLRELNHFKKADFEIFDFSKYDLIIALDSSTWGRVVGSELEDRIPQITSIAIDHHASNIGYGRLNLIDINSTSTSEIIYKLLDDWEMKIDLDIAESLLCGVVGDTGSFRYPQVSAETFEIAAKLMKAGADRDKINYNLFFNVEFKELKYLSEVLKSATLDVKSKIIWAAISYKKYSKLRKPEGSGFAGAFFQTVKGTKIGVFMVEKEEGALEVSFRAREKGIDASKISMSLGGGGHKRAAGATIRGMKFEKAVEKVLKVARQYTK